MHVYYGVCEEETGDGIPCPGLYPPGCYYEAQIGFHAPGVAGVWGYDHCEIDGVALCVDDGEGPEGLGGEGGVGCLGEEIAGGPEEVKEGIEEGEGVWEFIGDGDGEVGCCLFVVMDVECSYCGR